MIQYDFRKGGFWLRVFGVGVSVINRDTYPAPFSVRNGYKREIRIGRYGVKLLPRFKGDAK